MLTIKQNRTSGFSLTSNKESWTPILVVGPPIFQRNVAKLHCGNPDFDRKWLRSSYFQNPSQKPDYFQGVTRITEIPEYYRNTGIPVKNIGIPVKDTY